MGSPEAIQGVLDFISGLKQTRSDVTKTTDERMTHSEQEVVSALAEQFEQNMRIDETEVSNQTESCVKAAAAEGHSLAEKEEVKKPIFVKKRDRVTLQEGGATAEKKTTQIGKPKRKRGFTSTTS